ncbi:MAG: hypothetical protein IJQ67_02980 [Bacilli bacterium]|nr:hypothetical protein [Bacilli bacterium]
MKIDISTAKANLSKLIQCLIDGKEDYIIITKYGKPLVKMTQVCKNTSKRIGAAKKRNARIRHLFGRI